MRIPRKTKKRIIKGGYCFINNNCKCPFMFVNKHYRGDCKIISKTKGLNGINYYDEILDDLQKVCNVKYKLKIWKK